MARRTYTDENLVMQELDWEHEQVASRPGPVLVISNRSTLPFVLWHIPAIISAVGAQRGEQIRYHLSQGTFKEVFVIQTMRATSPNGQFGVEPADAMPPEFHLEVIAQKRFGSNIARLSRIVSIDPTPPKEAGQGDARPSPLRLMSADQSASEPPVAPETSSGLRR